MSWSTRKGEHMSGICKQGRKGMYYDLHSVYVNN